MRGKMEGYRVDHRCKAISSAPLAHRRAGSQARSTEEIKARPRQLAQSPTVPHLIWRGPSERFLY
uniref:Uncharacterized protein n=1 Tax=Anguilla anguilla TaxID=7936 RepID=A0A0E9WYV0_ANGAN